jgi:hypothetical protein
MELAPEEARVRAAGGRQLVARHLVEGLFVDRLFAETGRPTKEAFAASKRTLVEIKGFLI